jgi:plastocyanin
MRRYIALVCVLAATLAMGFARADSRLPVPEKNFLGTSVLPEGCTSEAGNPYETKQYLDEGWAPNTDGTVTRYATSACQRLHFSFGPIKVAPGQNDVLINPITVEKPGYDGYITRFRPDLVKADGSVPPIEQVHLHHGTWIQLTSYAGSGSQYKAGDQEVIDTRVYGSGPFFASGEEKTIGDFPRGYGFPVKATDHWDMLYMVHNATSSPAVVYITYDVDYVPATAVNHAGQPKMQEVYPVWLDVRPSSYPVFNVERYGVKGNFGAHGACSWPAQECASLNSWGMTEVGQGQPGNGVGKAWKFPSAGSKLGRIENFQGGTIVGLGGHLHPGGLTDEVDIQRGNDRVHIFTSEAKYWSHSDPTQVSAKRSEFSSWDFSMTVQGLPHWGVHVKPGDTIWLNATYDNTVQATYENMGIVVAFMAPDKPNGDRTAAALDVFDTAFTTDDSESCAGIGAFTADQPVTPVLCTHGGITHGAMPEASHFGGPDNAATATQWVAGPATTRVDIAAFKYVPGDLDTVTTLGVPKVALGSSITFVNEDAATNVYHSITSCKFPCNGPTGIDYPIANGESNLGHKIDFDSAELGYSPTWGPAKGQIGGSPQPSPDSIVHNLNVTASNGFTPGTYTYFCRIHPFMRGAFEVTA